MYIFFSISKFGSPLETGSIENEDPENEDRRPTKTKTPYENEDPPTKTKTYENEDSYENEDPLRNLWFSFLGNEIISVVSK